MPKPSSLAQVNLDIEPDEHEDLFDEVLTRDEPVDVPDRETPFRILLLGDFSGRASRGLRDTARLGVRKPVFIDRDNFEQVFAKLGVALRLRPADPEAPPIDIRFNEFDDFHPDRLYDQVQIFTGLRRLRGRLEDPETFAEAARELGATIAEPAPAPPRITRPQQVDTADLLSGASLLDQALEATERRTDPAAAAGPVRATDPFTNYLRSLVTPHMTPKPHPKQSELVDQVDDAIGDVMRGVLHHPDYQYLEAAWRALFWLIRGLETGENLKVYVLDVTRAELKEDLLEAADLRATGLYKVLVEQTVRTPGAHPWAVLAGNFMFGPGGEDLNLLGRIGLLAAQAGAPFIAGARPSTLACKSLAETPYPEDWAKLEPEVAEGWNFIRAMPESRYLGLVIPRFLQRLPFGRYFEQPVRFAFEEFGRGWRHDDYLWGNGAFVCAWLLGQSFTEYGWSMPLGAMLDVPGLPAHSYKEDGEPKLKPCAEVLLTQTAAEAMLGKGLMPLLSYQNGDRARLGGFRSLAYPGANLRGRWAG